jgi:hypothetical protein
MRFWVKVFIWSSSVWWISNFSCWAQDSNSNPALIKNSAISSPIKLNMGETLQVEVTELPSEPEGKIAVFLGNTDITSQVEVKGKKITYKSTFVPLVIGNYDLTIYQTLSPDNWKVLAVFQVKVTAASAPTNSPSETKPTTELTPSPNASKPATTEPNPTPTTSTATEATPTPTEAKLPTTESTPAPTESKPDTTETVSATQKPNLVITPKFTFNAKSQLFEVRNPDAGAVKPSTFLNLDFAGGLTAQYQFNNMKIDADFTLVGSTLQSEALRFGQIQNQASQIDLSEYAVRISDDNKQFAVGHLCFGNHPFLLNNLCSRGVSGRVKINDLIDVSVARMSSTSIVGFENLLGLDKNDNVLDGASLGLQLMQNQSGGVRLETTWAGGSRAPVANFNVGEIVDAEKSDGIGVRVTGSDDAGRLKVDAGFANSTFTVASANDPQLNEGTNVVPLDTVNRSAWYAEASYELLKDIKLDATRTLSASINFRTERIDPQFGSLGVTLQPDRLQTQYALNLIVAGATIQFQQNFSNDNIVSIPSLLKTQNNSTNINLVLPLQSILQNQSVLLPTISYGFQQTHQIGSIELARLGGFNDLGRIPDQLSTTNRLGLSWKLGTVDFNYQYVNAFQDNRQFGQEQADLRNVTNQLSGGWQATPQLRFTLGYNFVYAENIGDGITRFTSSPTIGASWEFAPGATFAANYNLNVDSDSLNRDFNRAESLELLLSWNFVFKALGRDLPASTFIRYGRQSAFTQSSFNDNLLNTSNVSNDAVSAGVNLSF